jgi:predicted aspartyl protease
MTKSAAIMLTEDTSMSKEDKKTKVSFSVSIDAKNKEDLSKLYLFKFSTGSAEDWLKFLQESKRVLDLKKWTADADAQLNFYHLMFEGEALTKFDTEMGSKPVDMTAIKGVIDAMTRAYLPRDCARSTISYLNNVTKPRSLTVEAFVTRIKKINGYLSLMPAPSNVPLSEDQLARIIERSVPSAWMRQYELNQALAVGSSAAPNLSTLIQYFKVCELNEVSSGRDGSTDHKKGKGTQQSYKSQNRYKSHSSSDEEDQKKKTRGFQKPASRSMTTRSQTSKSSAKPSDKWCPVHKTDSHSYEECYKNPDRKEETHVVDESKKPRDRKPLKKKAEDAFILEEDTKVEEESEEEELYSLTVDVANAYKVPPKMEVRVELIGNTDFIQCKALIDTGSSSTLINNVQKLRAAGFPLKKGPPITWNTKGGSFTTNKTVEITCNLPDFTRHRVVTFEASVDERAKGLDKYDIILGRDVLTQLGLKIDFAAESIDWDDMRLSLRSSNSGGRVRILAAGDTVITSANYVKADIRQVVQDIETLTSPQKRVVEHSLGKYQRLFDGKLGLARVPPISLQLKPDARPYQGRPYPIAQAHYPIVKKEIERLEQLGVLRRTAPTGWASPSFIIPKKNGEVRVVTDYREVNKRLERRPYPLPTISELLHRIDGFDYVTALDLSMGYYHLPLSRESQRIAATVLPWGHYAYTRLPMGVAPAVDLFQEFTSQLFLQESDFVLVYLDDLLIFSKNGFADHLNKINLVNLAAPKNVKQVRSFVGFVNFYREFLPQRSQLLAEITDLTKKGVRFQWTSLHQAMFDKIKRIMIQATLLNYPNSNEPFEIYADASDSQVGGVITQSKGPIAFVSKKLNDAQKRYTVGQKELLAVLTCLRTHRNILLGRRLIVYTDHKNNTYDSLNSDQVRRWRMEIEEYSPDFRYIPGEQNPVADMLSRFDVLNIPIDEQESHILEVFAVENPDDFDECPVSYKLLATEQAKVGLTSSRLKKFGRYSLQVTPDDKIIVPVSLQAKIINWYHDILLHPGATRMTQTLKQQFFWNGLATHVEQCVRACDTCQRCKVSHKKYGKLPLRQQPDYLAPWTTVAVDLVGPWTVRTRDQHFKLTALSIVDCCTNWVELQLINNKSSEEVALVFDRTWLNRYPRPVEVIHDNGS